MSVDDIKVEEVTPGCVGANDDGPDGWSKGGNANFKVYREHDGTYTKDGSYYALKVVTSSGGAGNGMQWPHADIYGKDFFYRRFQGRTMTLGAWVWTATGSRIAMRLEDNDGNSNSTQHTGASRWEWLEVTRTCDSSITEFAVRFRSDNDLTYYVSQPMLVFGSSIGEGNYTRPQGEIVWFEESDYSFNSYSGVTVGSNAEVNLEAESNGKIPKGAKAVHGRVVGVHAGTGEHLQLAPSNSTEGSVSVISQVSGVAIEALGWCPCDSDGDIWIRRGASMTNVYLKVNGVELR
tara:strand:- start:52 stop:927 length:876 start_codon:yes stop_codon:yes gene_type:complete